MEDGVKGNVMSLVTSTGGRGPPPLDGWEDSGGYKGGQSGDEE